MPTKRPWKSITLGGAVITIATGTLQLLDIENPEQIIESVLILIGAVITIYGRCRAKQKISLRKKKTEFVDAEREREL